MQDFTGVAGPDDRSPQITVRMHDTVFMTRRQAQTTVLGIRSMKASLKGSQPLAMALFEMVERAIMASSGFVEPDTSPPAAKPPAPPPAPPPAAEAPEPEAPEPEAPEPAKAAKAADDPKPTKRKTR
jgi:hypothetical protein